MPRNAERRPGEGGAATGDLGQDHAAETSRLERVPQAPSLRLIRNLALDRLIETRLAYLAARRAHDLTGPATARDSIFAALAAGHDAQRRWLAFRPSPSATARWLFWGALGARPSSASRLPDPTRVRRYGRQWCIDLVTLWDGERRVTTRLGSSLSRTAAVDYATWTAG